MAKRTKKYLGKLEHVITKVEEPKDPHGLYILHYQTYRGITPVDLPWKAYVTKKDYELKTIKDIMVREFKVPEHLVDKLIDKAKEVMKQDLSDFSDWD
jgi:hypothetical protein